jgi:hypothetical protein
MHLSLSVWLGLSIVIASLQPAAAQFNHKPYDELLRRYVKAGRVDYQGIKANDLAKLVTYLETVSKAQSSQLPKRDKLAFYLNAYNAIVIKAVIDHLPLSNVMKITGFFKAKRYSVAGRSLTLDALENQIIRPTFKDPRIHFALVCGARSCPPLMSRAFAAKTLERDLDRLATRFINGPAVKITGASVAISKLFEWYAQDFKDSAGSVEKYLAKYRQADAERLTQAGQRLSYQPYSWALNGK